MRSLRFVNDETRARKLRCVFTALHALFQRRAGSGVRLSGRRARASAAIRATTISFSAIMPRGYSPLALDVSRLQIDTLVAAGTYNAQVAAQAAAVAMMGLVGYD